MSDSERKLLFKVKVGYLDVPVYETYTEGDDLGEFHAKVKPHILLDKRLEGWCKIQTLIHELMHAAAWVGSQDNTDLNEEKWVDFSAASIVMIARDNPSLLTWIRAEAQNPSGRGDLTAKG